ncbi:MAG: MFS transporter [Anaerolineales bacterium]
MASISAPAPQAISESEYKRRIRAWTLYDWANSAFATTILAAVLPIYYSQEAGATLPSAAVATAYWSAGLSISLFIVAILSPILGTISDVMRGKKRFLAIFFGMGIIGTGLLVLVDTGDWMLASLLFVLGRIGWTAANVFYDALLPHVAREEDRDSVSARGFAIGYLGGGLLLAINIVMIQQLPGTWGARLSFLSVAVWWGVFSIPLFVRVPEPPSATLKLSEGKTVIGASFQRLGETLKDMRRYRELLKFLIAFLIYADGIGTIIEVAAIYGAELGFGSIELVLALLLVQFAAIPFSLIFGRLPSKTETRRPFYLAFVFYNVVALPLVGIAGSRLLPANVSGKPPEPYITSPTALGEGIYLATQPQVQYEGDWQEISVPAAELGTDSDVTYKITDQPGAFVQINFNGQRVKFTYSSGPDQGIWSAEIDGQPIIDQDTDQPLTINAYNPTARYGEVEIIQAPSPGLHTLQLTNTGDQAAPSSGRGMSLAQFEVMQPLRESSLVLIIGMIAAVEIVGLALSALLGRTLFSGLADKMDTKNGILLALAIYAIIAIWGFFLNSVVEFWFLAWMVAVVQGGSQALSRSLFSVMSPAAKSGEFFGLFSVMEKFSAIIGPLLFAIAATAFDSSRPAVLSIIAFFIIGGYLLTRVNVEEGRRVAREEDAALLT